MEERQLAHRAIDEVGEVGAVSRIDVDLVRDEQLRGRIGELPKDGLTTDHDEVALVRDRAGRAQNMLEIGTLHALAHHRLAEDTLPRPRVDREGKRACLPKRRGCLGGVGQHLQQ